MESKKSRRAVQVQACDRQLLARRSGAELLLLLLLVAGHNVILVDVARVFAAKSAPATSHPTYTNKTPPEAEAEPLRRVARASVAKQQEHGAEAALRPCARSLASRAGRLAMAATVLFTPAQCRRATATTSGRGGAPSHCALLLPPRHRRRARGSVRAVPPEQSSLPQAPAAAAAAVYGSAGDVKAALYGALEGANRGIFGMTSAKRSEIHGLVELLESRNPTPEPTAKLQDKVDGCWKLIYSTISILGKKRTKLGLRDFISLGDFLQIIDVKEEKAVNVIEFSARALKIFSGKLTIEASYTVTSQTRVDIKLQSSTITPEQLMNIFQKNYDMLLDIFNPEGWLEITYVDESLRIGRDDKGNIFVLERADPSEV